MRRFVAARTKILAGALWLLDERYKRFDENDDDDDNARARARYRFLVNVYKVPPDSAF